MTKTTDGPKPPPKGGRKGGTRFPQINLADAEGYCKRLVSKTHTGPQPSTVILKGVFDSATDRGRVRASAMKQYGLLDGPASGYVATDLAKNLSAAPAEEKAEFLQQAFFNSNVFKMLFDTFVGDTVSLAKVRQQTSQLGVHPENQEFATKLFMESAAFAGLATIDGELISVKSRPEPGSTDETGEIEIDTQDPTPEDLSIEGDIASESDVLPAQQKQQQPRAIIHVNVTLDSSLDTEKLQKQLALLRQFGAI